MDSPIKVYNEKLKEMEDLLKFFENELKDKQELYAIVEKIKHNLKKLRLYER